MQTSSTPNAATPQNCGVSKYCRNSSTGDQPPGWHTESTAVPAAVSSVPLRSASKPSSPPTNTVPSADTIRSGERPLGSNRATSTVTNMFVTLNNPGSSGSSFWDADTRPSMVPSAYRRTVPSSFGTRNEASIPGIGDHSSAVETCSTDVPFDTSNAEKPRAGGARLPLPRRTAACIWIAYCTNETLVSLTSEIDNDGPDAGLSVPPIVNTSPNSIGESQCAEAVICA
jgi:hypothetical protein